MKPVYIPIVPQFDGLNRPTCHGCAMLSPSGYDSVSCPVVDQIDQSHMVPPWDCPLHNPKALAALLAKVDPERKETK